MGFSLRAVAALAALAVATAECPNACSGHGSCTFYDECDCNQGYMANDCSERICPFGTAHVDGAKGDLDGDEDVSVSGLPVVKYSQMYPVGTVEGVDATVDDSAHAYMECSNKGICDRTTGMCRCFPAYEGYACQRASCPAVDGKMCGGHGVCKTVRELANGDYSNDYELWDADKGMACDCDPGYSGFDCSERECPIGVDPLYGHDMVPRYPIWTFRFYSSTADFDPASWTTPYTLSDTYRVKFYDVHGEDWITAPIGFAVDTDATTSAGLSAESLRAALHVLENEVVPEVHCTGTYAHNNIELTCAFPSNFGPYRVPELITTDSNGHSTLSKITSTVVFDKGVISETTDYFAQLCPDVSLVLSDYNKKVYTLTLTSAVTGTFVLTAGYIVPASGASGSATVAYSSDPTTMAANIKAAVHAATGVSLTTPFIVRPLATTDTYSIMPPAAADYQLDKSTVLLVPVIVSATTPGIVVIDIDITTWTSGSFALKSATYGFTTDPIAYDVTTALHTTTTEGNIVAALEAVNPIDIDTAVIATTPTGHQVTITFITPYGGIGDLIVDPASTYKPAAVVTTPTSSVKELTVATAGAASFTVLAFDGKTVEKTATPISLAASDPAADLQSALTSFTTVPLTNVIVGSPSAGKFVVVFNDLTVTGSGITLADGEAAYVERSIVANVVTVTLHQATGGSWTLSVGSHTTSPISYGAAPSVIDGLLDNWAAAGIGSTAVTGTNPYMITFNDGAGAGATQAASVTVAGTGTTLTPTMSAVPATSGPVTAVNSSPNAVVIDVATASTGSFKITTTVSSTTATTGAISTSIVPNGATPSLEATLEDIAYNGITDVIVTQIGTKYIVAFITPYGGGEAASVAAQFKFVASLHAPYVTASTAAIDFAPMVTSGNFQLAYGGQTITIPALATLDSAVTGPITTAALARPTVATTTPTGSVTASVVRSATRYVLTFTHDGGLSTLSATSTSLLPASGVVVAADTRNYVMQIGIANDPTTANNDVTALKRLKRCLGDADGDLTNSPDEYAWDYGYGNAGDYVAFEHPHLVKLIKSNEVSAPATHALLFWDTQRSQFLLMSKVGNTGAAAAATDFYVGATDGTLAMVYDDAETFTGSAVSTSGKVAAMAKFWQFDDQLTLLYDFTCDKDAADDALVAADIAAAHSSVKQGGHDDHNCIRKGDLVVVPFTLLAAGDPTAAGVYTNSAELRRIVNISPDGKTITLDRPLHYTKFNDNVVAPTVTTGMPLYKFIPSTTGSSEYDYATACAGRGLCDRAQGLCTCFRGYAGPECSHQSALSM